jgi:hypothetical protein
MHVLGYWFCTCDRDVLSPPRFALCGAGGRDQLFLADTFICSTPAVSNSCWAVWGRGDRTPFPVTCGVPIPVVHPAPFVVDGGVGSSP